MIIYTKIVIFMNIRIWKHVFMDLVDNISTFYDHHWYSHWNSHWDLHFFKNGHIKTDLVTVFLMIRDRKKVNTNKFCDLWKEHYLYEIKIINLCQKIVKNAYINAFVSLTLEIRIKIHHLWILSCLIIFGSFWTMFFFNVL